MIALTARFSVPEAVAPKAAYALRELCHRAGFGLRIVDTEKANIHYTEASVRDKSDAVVIRCHSHLYVPGVPCNAHIRGQRHVWEDKLLLPNEEPDLVGGAYRLLALADESQVAAEARDRRGTFLVNALPPARRDAVHLPIVEFHADALAEKIIRRWPQAAAAAAPRWPNGSRYAVVVTHDCDHLNLGAPAEIAVNLAKLALRRQLVYGTLAWSGLRHLCAPRQNPFCRFDFWQQWEQQRGIRSAFYLFVRPRGVPIDLNDCRSTAMGSALDWRLVQHMAAAGSEFGLHAPIGMRYLPAAFRQAREWLEAAVGRPVTGIRHHYFAFDWLRPHESHRMHAEAGFTYDTSMAYRDAPGFRSGTSLPYSAFDPVRDEDLPLTLLPCSLMDRHVLNNPSRDGARRRVALTVGRRIIETVRRCGGVIVFNWHQETAFNRLIYEGYMDVIDMLLNFSLAPDAWVATPQEVCSWWRQRSFKLDHSDIGLAELCARSARVAAQDSVAA